MPSALFEGTALLGEVAAELVAVHVNSIDSSVYEVKDKNDNCVYLLQWGSVGAIAVTALAWSIERRLVVVSLGLGHFERQFFLLGPRCQVQDGVKCVGFLRSLRAFQRACG